VLIEVPPDCPISAGDLRWAFAGLAPDVDEQTGEVLSDARLVIADEDAMLRHFGLSSAKPARRWRSVTPVVLPQTARPATRRDGDAQVLHKAATISAVRKALRHVGAQTEQTGIEVQREPFGRHGQTAETFSVGTRFAAGRLQHVELRFQEPRNGPLVLGDGRWLGLGLMAPVFELPGMFRLPVVEGLAPNAAPLDIADALRRAVMARVQDKIGETALPSFFSGHATDGAPLRSGRHTHLACAFDPQMRRLLIVAPHLIDGREATPDEVHHMTTLDAALAGFGDLRAGRAGLLSLGPVDVLQDTDPLLAFARVWNSVTPFVPTRHAKGLAPEQAIENDILHECRRRNWPEPKVTRISARQGARGGVAAMIRLEFAVARAGPILLGRTTHQGGGLFIGSA
jgi:CRISPR-associated protein Csb2